MAYQMSVELVGKQFVQVTTVRIGAEYGLLLPEPLLHGETGELASRISQEIIEVFL